MSCTDFFEGGLVFFAVMLSRYTPALNVNVIIPGQLVPNLFLMKCRIRFAL